MKTNFLILLIASLLGATGRGFASPYNDATWINPTSALTPYQQELLHEQQEAIIQAQEQKAAAKKEAAWEKFRDAETDKLAEKRDAALAGVTEKLSPPIFALQSQIAPLEQNAKELETLKIQSVHKNNKLLAKQLFQPKDPWRNVDGRIVSAKAEDFLQFSGEVLAVRTNGILIDGVFGQPVEPTSDECRFFVENFPNGKYPLADGEAITTNMNFVAHVGGKTTYQFADTTFATGMQTVRRLDYEQAVDNPPPDVIMKSQNQIVMLTGSGGADQEILNEITENQSQLSALNLQLVNAQSGLDTEKQKINSDYDSAVNDLPSVYAALLQQQAEQKKLAIQDKVLKSNMDAAERGDAYGLLRMGQRYRDSEGVTNDLTKARDYLTKAAAAGSPTAVEELSELNKTMVNSGQK